MQADHLRANALVNDALGSALRSGDHALGTVPALLKRVIAEQSWREFVTKRGEHVEHEKFADFVATPPLRGLGATVDLVRRVVADDTEVLDLLDKALQRAPGRPEKNLNNIQGSTGSTAVTADPYPAGTSKARALRKLRTESERGNQQAAELHAEVLADRISAHAAMVQAGFRQKTVSVPVGRPERVAAYLRKHMPRDALLRLAELLTKDNGDL